MEAGVTMDHLDGRVFVYRIDAQNRIDYVNDEWIDFAGENEAPELTRERVLGEPISGFIAGWETIHLYEIIYERVRRSGKEVRIPFRCDSPEKKRHFLMSIAPLGEGGLEMRIRVLRIDPVPRRPLLESSVERSPEMIVICSWCRRILIDEGSWVEIEDATGEKELFGPSPPSLTHEVCSDCLSVIHRRLDQ